MFRSTQEWGRLVVRETTNQFNKRNCIKPSEMTDNMKLLVLLQQPQGPLGPPSLLSVQATISGQSILMGTRVIRGRGDCFFRALIYSILETIIINPGAEQNMATFCDMHTKETAYIARPDDKERERIRHAIQMLTTGPDETCVSIHNLTGCSALNEELIMSLNNVRREKEHLIEVLKCYQLGSYIYYTMVN